MKRLNNFKKFVLTLVAVLTVAVALPISTEAKSANRIEMNGKSTMTIYQGETVSLKVKGIYKSNKKVYDGKKSSVWKKLKVSSSNKAVVAVGKNGAITAKKKGAATITLTFKENSKVKTSVKVKVATGKGSIKLSKKSVKLEPGETITIKVKSVTGLSSKEVTFKSDDDDYATVSENGTVTALFPGTTFVTVTSVTNKKVKATFKVTVTRDCEKYGHEWLVDEDTDSEGWNVTSEPTCKENGFAYRECRWCSYSEDRVLPGGHVWVVEKRVEAVKGITGGDYCKCSRCGEEEIHNPVYYQPTMEELEASLAAVKAEYPNNTPWTIDDQYDYGDIYDADGKPVLGGAGCNGFAIMCSNAIFGENVPGREHHDLSQIKAGDILAWGNHFSIVTRVDEDGYFHTADGNVGNSAVTGHGWVSWGGSYKIEGESWHNKLGNISGPTEDMYIITRWQ